MIKFLLRQPLYAWRTLGWLNKIEIIFLVGLIYIFTTGKIYHLYTDWLTYDWITPFRLTNLLTHVFIVLAFLSGPFILLYLLPKQPGLYPFYGKPLSTNQLYQLSGYFYFKYQTITLILYLLFLTALYGINWIAASASIFFILAYGLIVFILQFYLFVRRKSNLCYGLVLFLIFVSYLTIYILSYWYFNLPWIFDYIIICITGFIFRKILSKNDSSQLELIFPQKSIWQKNHQSSRLDFAKIPKFLPAKIQALFNKELLGLWRNSSYRRLKWLTFFSYIILLILIFISQLEKKDVMMTLLTGFIIWLHYSNYFNEKYVQPEPDWYFHTIPFCFRHLWISKFLVEFIFILVVLASFWIMLFVSGFNINEQFNLLLLILGFSVVVLSIMLNFQIMFYDDPRLAGYAYHFTIIFLLIMSVNYRLVGPLISIILLSFYFYKSYHYFKS